MKLLQTFCDLTVAVTGLSNNEVKEDDISQEKDEAEHYPEEDVVIAIEVV